MTKHKKIRMFLKDKKLKRLLRSTDKAEIGKNFFELLKRAAKTIKG